MQCGDIVFIQTEPTLFVVCSFPDQGQVINSGKKLFGCASYFKQYIYQKLTKEGHWTLNIHKSSPQNRPQRPRGGADYSSTLPSTLALDGGWVANATPGSFTPGKTRYQFYRRLGRPQGRSGRVRKSLPPHRDSIPGPSSPWRVATLTVLSQPLKHPLQKQILTFLFCANIFIKTVQIMFPFHSLNVVNCDISVTCISQKEKQVFVHICASL